MTKADSCSQVTVEHSAGESASEHMEFKGDEQ